VGPTGGPLPVAPESLAVSVTTLHRPAHREALWELEAAFDRGDLVTLFGRCTVEYSGRAASSLGPGDRLLVLKPDGTALVHTDENRTPVNWQPPGSEHRAAVRDGRLRVRSVRESPEETLDVHFEQIHQFSALSVSGRRSVAVTGSEEDLRQHILDDPTLVEDGFVPEATERETAAGPVDVFGHDADGTPVVVELKRRRVGPAAVGQLQRYVDALGEELPDGVAIRGILVAPSVTDRAREMLAERGLGFVAVDPPAATGEGDFDGETAADGEAERDVERENQSADEESADSDD
jgi:RecB family endonuclease NucS